MTMNPYSLYIHIPFCRHRCAYCDFNTYAGLDNLIPAYSLALQREIELVAKAQEKRLPVYTIFLGGGTPSLLPLVELEGILGAVIQNYDLLPGTEITLEANPGTVSVEYLRGLRSLGVNRLSFGVQSANSEELLLLEREHRYSEVIQAVTAARQARFQNINLDLIFGLPYQQLNTWQKTVELVLGLFPEHFALYALTLEHGTPMQQWTARGLLPEPDPDLAAEMYEWASERLELAGYRQYEISNWARHSDQGDWMLCRHNLQYWRGLPYLGFGAGAHGYAAGVRTANVLSPAAYIQRCLETETRVFPRSPATVNVNIVNREDEMGETMMMGLRLTEEGVADEAFFQRFGVHLEEQYSAQIQKYIRFGLLEWSGEQNNRRLHLTPRGRLLGNQVFQEFI
jgi:oxygen-independent coproporphyrinogen III oxidase